MSDGMNLFATRYKAKLDSYRDQANHYYRMEQQDLGARHLMEREFYRSDVARNLEYLKQAGAHDLQNKQHQNLHEIEDKRGILAKWVEEFRSRTSTQLEALRQAGTEQLQSREHVHQRMLWEFDQAENRFKADAAHANTLELARKQDELVRFQNERKAIYDLEQARFSAMLTERQGMSAQIIAEYGSRNAMGQSTLDATVAMLATGLQDNNKLNEMILSAVIGKLAGQGAHKQSMAEIDRQAEQDRQKDDGAKAEINKLLRDWAAGG